ncbi:MAG: hypothetical protein Q4P11_05825, partial [Methanobrevibacter sp.]|nr:hypothetical protein [Methanobrevibacter sp.]
MSFSFAADLDAGSFVCDFDDEGYLPVSNDSDSAPSLDDDSFSDFIEGDTAYSDDSDEWVLNLEEDSRDDDWDFEPNSNPRSDPLDNRTLSHLDVSGFSKYYLNSTQLVGHLKDENDMPLADRNVSIRISNGNYIITTDSLGMFSLNINLKPNNYTTNISFAGDSLYTPCNKTILVKVFTMPTTITSSDVVKYYLNGTQWVARLLDVSGNPLAGK